MKKLFLGLLFCAGLAAYGQSVKKEVLFTIDGKPFYTDEFARVYKKNLDLVKDESQKDLDQYLELFIGYKLKITKAYRQNLQDNPKYQAELKTYRNQLAKNYLTDSKVTNELMQEAYDRYLKEIKAAHILILVDENATPADTLKAYKQIQDIRKRALAGEDFGKLAQESSQDPSAKENKGELGYFSAFRMVYPFETGAYKTPKGQVSGIIRTRFGYHLIKVEDIRDNRGEVSVAHIMISKPSTDDKEAAAKAKTTIDEIYQKLKQGENFEALAQQFSDDKTSASKGGQIGRFASGELSSEEFEDVAFSLTKDHPVSEPFQTAFGWHIVKLLENFPVKTFDEMKTDLESKIKRDDRSRLIVESMNEKLRKKYTIKRDDKVYTATAKAVSDAIYESKWALPTDSKPYDKTLVTIADRKLTGTDFLNHIATEQREKAEIKPLARQIDAYYQSFLDSELNKYYNDNLENEFPEFADVMTEYRDGLLLFDLMEKEIWEKSKTDTVGLKDFYNLHKDRYQWKNRVKVMMVSSTKEDVLKKAQKMLKEGKDAAAIKAALNTKEAVNVMVTEGTFEEGSDVLPSNVTMKKEVTEPIKKGSYFFAAKVLDTIPAGPRTLEEAKGKVINDYQQFLEENWVTNLKKEFSIQVDQAAFARVKKEIKP